MDDDKRLKPPARTQPTGTPSLEWAVDNCVEKPGYACVFSLFLMNMDYSWSY